MSAKKATDKEIMEAYRECGSGNAAARKLGMNSTSIYQRLKRMGIHLGRPHSAKARVAAVVESGIAPGLQEWLEDYIELLGQREAARAFLSDYTGIMAAVKPAVLVKCKEFLDRR